MDYTIKRSDGTPFVVRQLEVNGPDNRSTKRQLLEARPSLDVDTVTPGTNTIGIQGDKLSYFNTNSEFRWVGSTNNDGIYTIQSVSYDSNSNTTIIVTNENITGNVPDGSLLVRVLLLHDDLTYRFIPGFQLDVLDSFEIDGTYTVHATGSKFYNNVTSVFVVEPIRDDIDTPIIPPIGNIQYTAESDTSLSFAGAGTLQYGEIFNTNFLRLMEHFAADVPPENNPNIGINPNGAASKGQLWYDTANDVFRVYNGTSWDLITDIGALSLRLVDAEDGNKDIHLTASESNLPSPWDTVTTPNKNRPGVVFWPESNPPVGEPLFRILDADGNDPLCVEYNNNVVINSNTLIRGEATITGSQPDIFDHAILNVRGQNTNTNSSASAGLQFSIDNVDTSSSFLSGQIISKADFAGNNGGIEINGSSSQPLWLGNNTNPINVGINLDALTTEPSAPLDIGGDILFYEGGGDVTVGPDIHFVGSGLIGADDDLILVADGSNIGTGRFIVNTAALDTSSSPIPRIIASSDQIKIGKGSSFTDIPFITVNDGGSSSIVMGGAETIEVGTPSVSQPTPRMRLTTSTNTIETYSNILNITSTTSTNIESNNVNFDAVYINVVNDRPIQFIGPAKTIQIGTDAGLYNPADTPGISNIAIGDESYFGALGSYNVAIGQQSHARSSNSAATGFDNISIGRQTAYAITTGSDVISIGQRANYSLTTSSQTISIGSYAHDQGNCEQGVFIGSLAGRRSQGTLNVAIGISAMGGGNSTLPMSGSENVAVGFNAGSDIYDGNYNISIGSNAGSSVNDISGTICIGKDAGSSWTNIVAPTSPTISGLISIGTGSTQNQSSLQHDSKLIAIGYNTLKGDNLTNPIAEVSSIAIGEEAGRRLSDGNNNIALGTQSLGGITDETNLGSPTYNNTNLISIGTRTNRHVDNSNYCVSLGSSALEYASNVDYNVAIGSGALRGSLSTPVSGSANIAIGRSAGGSITSGTGNVLIGNRASSDGVITGSDNVYIGNNVNTLDAGTDSYSNAICIGANAVPQGSNTITLGNSNVTGLYCNVTTITSLSDIRDKIDVSDFNLGLEFINSIDVIKYRLNPRDRYSEINDGSKADNTYQIGVSAQQIQEISNVLGIDFPGLDTTDPEKLKIGYTTFIMPLINSVKELKQKLDEQSTQISQLFDEINRLKQ